MNDPSHPSTLAGRRYACLVRCSTDPQADTSIPDQFSVLHAFGHQHGMIHAGPAADFLLEGVSGSHPADRSDIDRIIERKQRYDDFDVLLVQDLSRLTRGGVEHGGKVEFDLAAHGIKVVFAGSQLPEGDHAGIVKSVEYYAAQQFAKGISFGVARGQMSAILDGRQVHCLRPPFAVDRLYVSADGRPLHILRNRTDGTQQRLDPQTLAVLQTYPKPVKGRTPVRGRKQAGERVLLIPGDPAHVQTVRQMFRRVLVDGWGDWRVAKELNDAGTPSPTGKPWKRNGVKSVLRNPVYTGIGIANRRSGARYHERSAGAPRKLSYELTDVARQRRPTNRHRPRVEWVEQRHPALDDFLGTELRDLAVAYQRSFLTGAAKQPRARKDKHVDSLFILKNVLHSKQGGYPMTGRTQGSKARPYRYYHVARAAAVPSSDPTMRLAVPAGPIERAVLGAVQETLIHPSVRDRVVEAILAQQATRGADSAQVDQWERERADVRGQIEFVIDALGSIGREAAGRKVRQLEARMATLNGQIERAATTRPSLTPMEVEGLADGAVARLATLADGLGTLPNNALRQLIASIVVRLEVDLVTRQLAMKLALPSWVMDQKVNVEARMGFDGNFLQTSAAEAQTGGPQVLAAYDCDQRKRDCYDCRRRRAA